MREYMRNYIDEIETVIKKGDKVKKDFIEDHLTKISFFQHERFIHLCVTLFYACVLLVFLFMTSVSLLFVPIVIILVVFVILYIRHYFFLENGVQYMYKQYDKLKELS